MDYMKAINAMTGREKNSNITGLTKDSKDIDILDYLAVQLCHCIDTKKMAFHGGYTLNKVIPNDAGRATYDIDVSIAETRFYEDIKKVLINIGENLINDGVITHYRVKDAISKECSGGIDFYRFNKKKLGADIGIRDCEQGLVPMNLYGTDIMRFTIERMLSDKIRVIYSDHRLKRAKDLYDFYLLTNCFDFKMSDLRNQINADGGIDLSKSPLCIDDLIKYKSAYDSIDIKDPRDTSIVLKKFEFNSILERLIGIIECIDMDSKWDCKTGSILLC